MTESSFKLPVPAYEAYTWVLRDEHAPAALAPLFAGPDLAAEPGADPPRRLRVNGFGYGRVGAEGSGDGDDAFGRASSPASVAELTSWRQEWVPQVEAVAGELEAFDPATVPARAWQTTIEAQRGAFQRVFFAIHRTAAMPAGLAARRFSEAFAARFGAERVAGDALVLIQGFPNCSLDRAGALWDLSRLARADPSLLDALAKNVPLPDSATGRELQAGLDAMLAAFGRTSHADMLDLPTWGEDPAIPLAMIGAYAQQDDNRSPRLAAAAQREQRLALEAGLRSQAESDPSVAALIPLMEMAQQLLPNVEDHNFLSDQRLEAASRVRWLAIGRHLAARGAIAGDADVFYLYPREVEAALEGETAPSQAELDRRRSHLAACRESLPPPVLGKPFEPNPEDTGFDLKAKGARIIRGVAASRGSFRGRGRVIETLTAAATLVQGDILVCRSTTPPWSPFLGIIAALVTNSGGALSHGSIVARELGIPTVAGSVNATALIPDGATITVDGTNGLVIVE